MGDLRKNKINAFKSSVKNQQNVFKAQVQSNMLKIWAIIYMSNFWEWNKYLNGSLQPLIKKVIERYFQLLIFVQEIDETINIFEDLLQVSTLKVTTTGED